MDSIRHFLNALRRQVSRQLSLAVAIGSLGGLLLVAQAWLLAQVVNAVIFQSATLADVMPWLWAMLALLGLRALLVLLSEQVAFSAAAAVKQGLRRQLLDKIGQLGPAWLQGERSGELATVVSEGVEAMEAYYSRYLPAMSLAALIPLTILVFVLPMDWQSALVMLVTAPLIPFFMILIGRGAERLNQRQWLQLQRMGGYFLDVIQGLTTLRLFNASRREAAVIARVSEDYRQATMKVLRVAFLSALALEFFATVSIAIVAVLIGFRLLFGEMDFFNGFFVLLLAPEFYLPLRNLGTQYHARMHAMGAAEKMLGLLEQQPGLAPDCFASTGPADVAPQIDFNAVSFTYANEQPALAALDCRLPAGKTTALVGPSGAGKTTLAKLLLKFIQADSGEILVDTQPLSALQRQQWLARVSWVPQQPRLFHASIAENIALGQPSASRDAIIQAARAANAMTFIEQLPDGLDTLVGEGARGLSGGQVQRLALARAFLRDSALVILDEATANLDAENEVLLQDAIERLGRGRTMLVIAHRLQTVRRADQLLVMQQGRIVQSGQHAQLAAVPGLYQSLLQAQMVMT